MRRISRFPRSFAFRLTEPDGERLDAVAAAAGTTPGEWARAVVSRALGIAYERRLVRRRFIDAVLVREVLGEFNRQGNNLNQVARKLNSISTIDTQAARVALEVIHVDHHAALEAVLDAIGAERHP